MLKEDIIVGKCYINTNNIHQVLVRKVLSIESDKVRYEFLSGGKLKHGVKFNKVSLNNFAKWATSKIDELSSYEHLTGFKKYKNYTALSVSGKELLKITDRKANLYLKKGILKWVDENTLQFTTDEIENRLLHYHAGELPEYMLEEKNTCCVVCGNTVTLTKHHIVPNKDLPFYSLEIKQRFCNLLAVCFKCHKKYEDIKTNVTFKGYTYETAINWMNHFIESMKPKYLPKGWHILTGVGKKNKI